MLKSGLYNAVLFFFALIFVVIEVLIINYLLKLEKIGCKCAMDWRRHYILFFLILSILHVLSTFFLDENTVPLIQVVMIFLGVLNVIFVLQYVNKLKVEKCKCSESIYKEVLTFIAIFNAVLYSLLFIFILYFIFVISTYRPIINNQSTSSKKNKFYSVRKIKKPQYQELWP